MKTSAIMFLLFAAFVLAAVGIYNIASDEFAGITLFLVLALAMLFIAYLCLRAGDTELEKRLKQERGEDVHHGEMHLPPPSIWPFVIAVGAATAGWGSLLKVPILIGGLVIILCGAVGWAGGFRAINRDVAAWGEVWRYRQYKNLSEIEEELEREGRTQRPGE